MSIYSTLGRKREGKTGEWGYWSGLCTEARLASNPLCVLSLWEHDFLPEEKNNWRNLNLKINTKKEKTAKTQNNFLLQTVFKESLKKVKLNLQTIITPQMSIAQIMTLCC